MTSLAENLDSLDAERRRYTLQTLANHLDAAGQNHRLQSLFVGADWMHARVGHNRFRYDGYLEDVAIGFRNVRPRAATDEASLVQALRLALVSTTVMSLAAAIPVGLVVGAVRRSIWPAARAIGVATTMESALDQHTLCWRLLELPQLSEADRRELSNLLDEAAPNAERLEFWTGIRRSMDEVRGRWTPPEVAQRSHVLLCTIEPFMTSALTVGEHTHEPSMLHRLGRPAEGEFAEGVAQLAETQPAAARAIVLSKLRYLRMQAARGFEAIRDLPGFSDGERREAAALLTFALDPSAATLGLPHRGSVLDGDTVARIAPTLTAAQASTLVDAVRDARLRTKTYGGNAHRARALGALAERLPAGERAGVRSEAVDELRSIVNPEAAPAKRLKKVRLDVVFDDYAVVDEGLKQDFLSWVEDLSDLEAEYAALAIVVEDLAAVIPDADHLALIGAAILPLEEYGWVCVRLICALVPRLRGELAELRDDLVERSLETLERLPPDLARDHWRCLVPLLDDARVERLLADYRFVHDENAQVRALALLAPRLGDALTRRQAEQQLQLAAQLDDEERIVRALGAVAPLLDATTEARAVELALDIVLAWYAMKAVATLAPHLSERLRAHAIAGAYERGLESWPEHNSEDAQTVEAWADLMPWLAAEQRREALREATAHVVDQQLQGDFKRLVIRLGPFLDSDAVNRLEAYKWDTPKELVLLVHACAGHLLSPAEQSALLDEIATLPSAEARRECHRELFPYLAPELRPRSPHPDTTHAREPATPHEIADRLAELMGGNRAAVLALCASEVSAFSDTVAARIAEAIAEICQDWEWL